MSNKLTYNLNLYSTNKHKRPFWWLSLYFSRIELGLYFMRIKMSITIVSINIQAVIESVKMEYL